MKISEKYESYNARRYSRPWIGKITSWPTGGKAEIGWGSYYGDDNGGEVVIEAQPGDIVRHGQRDNRGNNTDAGWYIVDAVGNLISCTAAEAHTHWIARQSAMIPIPQSPVIDISGISTDILIAELARRGVSINDKEAING